MYSDDMHLSEETCNLVRRQTDRQTDRGQTDRQRTDRQRNGKVVPVWQCLGVARQRQDANRWSQLPGVPASGRPVQLSNSGNLLHE